MIALAVAVGLVFAPPARLIDVTFSIEAPKAKAVSFASDCFGWDEPRSMHEEGGVWKFPTQLPSDVRVEYQFVVDAKWTLDPKNAAKIDNGLGSYNSVYVGPDYRFDVPDQEPKKPMVRQVLRVGKGEYLREVVTYRTVGPFKDMPILVYGDGTEYEKRLKPQNILQNLFEDGKVPPCVLVLVPPKDRMKEYWKESAGYERFLVDDVLPAVRKATKATKDPKRTFVGGASLGGLIAMRMAEGHPEVFAGGVHSQSGAFWASPSVLSRSQLGKLSPSTRLYFCWGNYEGVLTASNDRITDALKRMDRPFGQEITNEGHNWTAWRRRYATGVTYLLSPLLGKK